MREMISKTLFSLECCGEAIKDSSGKNCGDVNEQCIKKPKVEQNSSANLRMK